MWKPLCSYWPLSYQVFRGKLAAAGMTPGGQVYGQRAYGELLGYPQAGALLWQETHRPGAVGPDGPGAYRLLQFQPPPAPAGRPYAYGGLCTIPRCLTNACAVRQYITPAGIRCGFFIICLFYFPVCLTEAVYNFQTAERLLYFVWAHIYSATKTTVFLFFRWVAINHAVYHLHQRVHVPFFLRPLKYDIGPPARSKGGFPPSSRRDPPPCPPLWCWQSGC